MEKKMKEVEALNAKLVILTAQLSASQMERKNVEVDLQLIRVLPFIFSPFRP